MDFFYFFLLFDAIGKYFVLDFSFDFRILILSFSDVARLEKMYYFFGFFLCLP